MINHAAHVPGWLSAGHGGAPFRNDADKARSSDGEEIADNKDIVLGYVPRHRDQGLLLKAFVGAVAIHLLAMFITLPQFKQWPVTPKTQHVISVKKYIPPPPRVERPQPVRGATKKAKRIIPIPDPTPADLEPIREPQPEFIAGDPIAPGDVEFLIGEPEGPPSGGGHGSPSVAGVGGITNPRLIDKTKPEYPEMARRARLESRVFLRAVICADGTVREIEIMGCDCPDMGFEEAAIAAVTKWRYEPAILDDKPVDVYFTVIVEFTIE